MMVTITICPIIIPAFAKDPIMFCDTVEVAVSLYTVYVDCVGLFDRTEVSWHVQFESEPYSRMAQI